VAPLARLAYRRARRRGPAALLRTVRLTVPGSAHQIPEEIQGFLALMRSREPRAACEIGVADGGTTMLLAHAAASLRKLVAIDVNLVRPRTLAALAPRPVALHLLERSSFDPATVAEVRVLLEGDLLDVLFIDGSHVYEDARADYLAYRELVRHGGLIAFHDIVPDRGRAYWAGGVPQLWAELREHAGTTYEFVRDRSQDAFGIGVVEHEPGGSLPAGWVGPGRAGPSRQHGSF
jgi:predicted O-methyltransferase YrrM